LAIVRCLEETRWLVNENRHPVLIYTDHECLKTALQNSDKGRIIGWQLRLSEYDFRIIHIKGKENALADGMSRLPVEVMDFGRPGKEESALELMNAVGFTTPPTTRVAVKGLTRNSVAFARPGTGEVAVALDEEGVDKRWEYWLADEWYAGVVFLKLFGKLREKDGGEDSLTVWRWWTRKAAVYQLIDEPDDYPLLAYTERNRRRSWCVRESEVDKVLEWAHDCYGHYAVDLTVKRLIGHYYWSTRVKDTHAYCRSCRSCQLTGGKRPSQVPRPVVQLQPMDMIVIDGLGPISPESNQGGHRYILIAVNYFTRYAWAKALPAINGSAIIDLVATISRTFGVPRSVYTDNATYFVSGAFPDFLASRGVRQFPAPKTHPSSVGLLERYVQLVLYGIRKIVVGGGNIHCWSFYLDQVVHAMNTREVRVHGYSPAELLFRYNPVIHHHDFTVRDRQAAHDLQKRQHIWEDSDDNRNTQLDNHLVTRDEALELTRQRYFSRFVAQQGKKGRFPAPREGDLVLLRWASLDNRYDKKLEAHWEGPFRLSDLTHHGRSG